MGYNYKNGGRRPMNFPFELGKYRCEAFCVYPGLNKTLVTSFEWRMNDSTVEQIKQEIEDIRGRLEDCCDIIYSDLINKKENIFIVEEPNWGKNRSTSKRSFIRIEYYIHYKEPQCIEDQLPNLKTITELALII